jgi:hypothetical protein
MCVRGNQLKRFRAYVLEDVCVWGEGRGVPTHTHDALRGELLRDKMESALIYVQQR